MVMDAASLMQVLSRTLDPSQREEAEKQLEEVGESTLVVLSVLARWNSRRCTKNRSPSVPWVASMGSTYVLVGFGKSKLNWRCMRRRVPLYLKQG